MDTIPRELLERIFAFLPPRYIWLRARNACRLWRLVADEHPSRWLLPGIDAMHFDYSERIYDNNGSLSYDSDQMCFQFAFIDSANGEAVFQGVHELYHELAEMNQTWRESGELLIPFSLCCSKDTRDPEYDYFYLPKKEELPTKEEIADWTISARTWEEDNDGVAFEARVPLPILTSNAAIDWDIGEANWDETYEDAEIKRQKKALADAEEKKRKLELAKKQCISCSNLKAGACINDCCGPCCRDSECRGHKKRKR